jgi:DNA-binding NtrC family response regulator
MLEDRQGHIWIGTQGKGAYRYDGEQLHHYTTAVGLAHDWVYALLEDRQGHIWMGTFGGGVSRFDGQVFQTLSQRDGLAHDTVQGLLEDRQGHIWIATEGGVARYRPQQTPPKVRLTDVVCGRHYGSQKKVFLPISQELIALEFQGGSFTTRPDKLAYVYRLQGDHDDWRTTYTRRVEYQNLSAGTYVFQVRAVDRDLNYSEIAVIHLVVEPDSFKEGMADVLSGSEQFVGGSPAVQQVQAQLEKVASTDWTVLIRGETGSGKGLAAQTLHRLSPRRGQPFIPVNCGAIPEGLVESELFGHEKGAFTGAVARRLGKVELAAGGTLFLDEIGDMPPATQVKLLRFLEAHAFERVGALQADVRIVAATNRNLEEAVGSGAFREDLIYRLGVFSVVLPPLRQRLEDLPVLVTHFIQRFAHHLNRSVPQMSPEAMWLLEEYSWPGNVRELEHLIQRAVLVCDGPSIKVEDLSFGPLDTGMSVVEKHFVTLEAYEWDVAAREKRYLERVLEATKGVVYGEQGAAHILAIHPEKLRARMKKLGVRRTETD